MDAELRTRIEAVAACLKRYGVSEVYVFGSAVDGSLRPGSDLELAVVDLPDEVFFRAMAEASRIAGRPVDLVALDRGDEVAAALLASGELRRVA